MKSRQARSSKLPEEQDTEAVQEILNNIPSDTMAEASFRSKAYARALLHYELHIRNVRSVSIIKSPLKSTSKKLQAPANRVEMRSLYEKLQKIYSHMDEPDGMEGITPLFNELNLEQQILEHESAGRWLEAQTCYEISLQQPNPPVEHHIGFLNCLKSLGHLGFFLNQLIIFFFFLIFFSKILNFYFHF